MSGRVYLYALLSGSPQIELLSEIENNGMVEPVLGIWHNNIGMAISRAPEKLFTDLMREEAVDWLARHQKVMEDMQQNYTIIPVKMGTVFDNVDEVRHLLEEKEGEVTGLLNSLVNMQEWRLMLSWRNMVNVIAAIGEETEIKSYKTQLSLGTVEQQDMIKIGEMVDISLKCKQKSIRDKVISEFYPIVEKYFMNRANLESTVVDALFLVHGDRQEEMMQKLVALHQKYREEFDFRISGPQMPKSFATVHIKKITGQQIVTALEVLRLTLPIDLTKIIAAKRKLLYLHHPDMNAGVENVQVQKIITAARLLEEYCRCYELSSIQENPANAHIIQVISVEQ